MGGAQSAWVAACMGHLGPVTVPYSHVICLQLWFSHLSKLSWGHWRLLLSGGWTRLGGLRWLHSAWWLVLALKGSSGSLTLMTTLGMDAQRWQHPPAT